MMQSYADFDCWRITPLPDGGVSVKVTDGGCDAGGQGSTSTIIWMGGDDDSNSEVVMYSSTGVPAVANPWWHAAGVAGYSAWWLFTGLMATYAICDIVSKSLNLKRRFIRHRARVRVDTVPQIMRLAPDDLSGFRRLMEQMDQK